MSARNPWQAEADLATINEAAKIADDKNRMDRARQAGVDKLKALDKIAQTKKPAKRGIPAKPNW